MAGHWPRLGSVGGAARTSGRATSRSQSAADPRDGMRGVPDDMTKQAASPRQAHPTLGFSRTPTFAAQPKVGQGLGVMPEALIRQRIDHSLIPRPHAATNSRLTGASSSAWSADNATRRRRLTRDGGASTSGSARGIPPAPTVNGARAAVTTGPPRGIETRTGRLHGNTQPFEPRLGRLAPPGGRRAAALLRRRTGDAPRPAGQGSDRMDWSRADGSRPPR